MKGNTIVKSFLHKSWRG